MKTIDLVDTTLRDAHQCLWATRMTTAMMLPVADRMDRIGFHALDFMGMIQFDVCVRYLKEDPWERIRQVRQRVTRTPLKAAIRSRSLIGFDMLAEDVNLLWVERLVANGIRQVVAFDALADLENIVPQLLHAKRLGVRTIGALVFCESPVHPDSLYAEKARELVDRAHVDAIMIKDSGGLLTPDRIRTLVPAMRASIGPRIALQLHSHCITGLAPLVYLEGVKAGVDQVDCAIDPLANGPAQPATQTTVSNLRGMGYEVDVDDALIDEVSSHFRRVAQQEGKPLGVPMAYDAFHYEHQVPGGMLTNLRFQLEQAGLEDKYEHVLAEIAQIRRELGWPIMVTPFAQLVATQAVLNVVQGERYKVVPDEVRKYALGYYGKLLAPVEPDALDRIIANSSPSIPLQPELPSPAVPMLRTKYPNATDDERLLRFMFAGSQVDDMLAAGPMVTSYAFEQPLTRLLKELAKRPKLGHLAIQTGDLRLEMSHRASHSPVAGAQG
jgi:oxaloacetate decarboxylase (Na+ extruding) subunit alpha